MQKLKFVFVSMVSEVSGVFVQLNNCPSVCHGSVQFRKWFLVIPEIETRIGQNILKVIHPNFFSLKFCVTFTEVHILMKDNIYKRLNSRHPERIKARIEDNLN